MNPIYLETPNLILRALSDADLGHLIDLDSDPNVVRFISDGKPSARADVEAAIVRIRGLYERFDHRLGLWAAIEKRSGAFVGWFHLRPDKKHLDDIHNLEIGYRLKASFWGKGLATEVSRLLVRKAFIELGAETVFATAMKDNHASTAVMRKIGLKFDSDFIENQFPGENKNAVKYVLTKSEWLHSVKSIIDAV